MATIDKIERANKDGSKSVRWRVRWVDTDGKRRNRKFKTRKAADSKLAKVAYRLDAGLKAEGGTTQLVIEAVQAWVDGIEALVKSGKRERSTLKQYDEHRRLHIASDEIARLEMRKLTAPDCVAFAKRLQVKLSDAMARKVLTSFKSAMDEAVRAGHLTVNPAEQVSIDGRDRRLLSAEDAEKAEKAAIPDLHLVKAIMEAAAELAADDKGRALAMFSLFTFAGLRASELRGLPLQNLLVFHNAPVVKIRQRADTWNRIGPPKSKAAYRTIPLGPMAVEALRAWCAHITGSAERLVFATEDGKPYSYTHIYRHVLIPVMERAAKKLAAQNGGAAAMVSFKPKVDNAGQPIVRDGGHFAGPYCPVLLHPTWSFHEMRHVAASLWIAGGANPKLIQKRMGHSKLQTTMDIYGHLWEDVEDDIAMATSAEARVFNARKD
ncbi:MAG: tyrosine-type recombinase/integrase [Rhodospirillaceae bacterium]